MRRDPHISLFRPSGAMGRRTLLNRGVALMGGLVAGLSLRPGRASAQVPARPTGGSRTWNVVVGGELMVSRPFAMHDEPAFMSIIKLLRESDATYSHLEMNFGEFDKLSWAAKGNWGGSYMIAEPSIAKDLKWAGIDMLSLAHNHSMDWGVPGMLSTIQACEDAGIAYAGTGRDLEEARSPAFVEKKKGRVALISVSSGNTSNEWAGLPKGSIPGRPGLNALRLTQKYMVDRTSAEQLRAIGKRLGTLNEPRSAPGQFNITPGNQSGQQGFFFVEGDKFEIQSFGHPEDLEGNMRAIEHAKSMADFVIVAHHCNQSEAQRGDLPMKFARAFAQAAVDAGADLYVGHGWHRANGIEIYKNKPLIHGTGNFWAQNEYIERVPADSYEAHGYDLDTLTTLNPGSGNLHPGTGGGDGTWWTAAVYQFHFEDGKVREIKLHPIEMGWDVSGDKPTRTRSVGRGEHVLSDGRPLMASGAQAQKILERLQRVYATYGTKVEIENGIGVIRVSAEQTSASRGDAGD